jgi:hypothetical protein
MASEFELPSGSRRKILTALAYALGLAILGHALWEIAVRPGITAAESRIRSIVTLGSVAVRDAPYSSAALDPTPLPSLLWLGLVAMVPPLALGMFLSSEMDPLYRRRMIRQVATKAAALQATNKALETSAAIRAVLAKRLWWLRAALVVLVLTVSVITSIASSVVNEAVAVWRTFHANLEMLGPHLTDADRLEFRAAFAGMKTRADYVALHGRLLKMAATSGVTLLQATKHDDQ